MAIVEGHLYDSIASGLLPSWTTLMQRIPRRKLPVKVCTISNNDSVFNMMRNGQSSQSNHHPPSFSFPLTLASFSNLATAKVSASTSSFFCTEEEKGTSYLLDQGLVERGEPLQLQRRHVRGRSPARVHTQGIDAVAGTEGAVSKRGRGRSVRKHSSFAVAEVMEGKYPRESFQGVDFLLTTRP